MAYYVSSGQVSSGIILNNDSMYVYDGGTANATTVDSGGILNVLDGGTANDTILNSSGFMNVSAGGTANGIIINGTNDYSYPTWYCKMDGLTVSAGGLVSDVILNSGRMVNDGGTVRNVTVEEGLFTIEGYSDTALTENITVNDGGIISFFMNPRRVNDVTVNSGGAVSFDTPANGGFRFDGPGSVTNITVNRGGKFMGLSFSEESVLIEDMARISNAIVSAGDFANVIRNQIADGISIENGGSLSVWDGAKSVDVTVKSGGSLGISTGGKFANISFDAGGKFSGFTFNESAVIEDAAHVQFNHVSVESEEYETAILSRNQTATDVTVQSGGSLAVEKGGAADNVTVKSGGDLRVLEGATATDITVEAGGKINGFSLAESASIADIADYDFSDLNLSVERYNDAFVNAGQSVKNIAVDGGLSVNNGGSAENITVNRGDSFRGTMEVGKGGTADHITIKSDSFLDIAEGAAATNVTIEAGGRINGFRLAESVVIEDASHFHLSNLTVDLYSFASVYDGQTVTNVTANYYMYVCSGGTAVDVTVSDSYNQMTVYRGGTVDLITVKSGADLWVREGAAATNITVDPGGKINGFSFSDTMQIADWSEFSVSNATVNDWLASVYAGQTVTDVTVNGGMEVEDGGTAENIAVNEYGSLIVYDGGTAANVIVRNNGSLTVYDGADVSAVTVEAGGGINGFSFGEETVTFEKEFHFANAQISQYYAYVYRNQTASDITVSGNTLYVTDGGYASDITVKNAGVLSLEGDGAAADVTVKSGGKLEIKDAGSASHITVEAGGSINGFTFGDGTVVIEDASVLSGLTVSSEVQVSGFQKVTDLTVEPGGSINGFIFGNETVVVENASQLSGVTVKSDASVYENQSVTNVNVGVGGHINGFSFWSEDPVEDASRLSDVYINNYSSYVYSGQTVTNITNFGYDSRLFVYSGGKIGGTLSFGDGLWVQVDAGGIVDFTVAGRTAGSDCLVDDLSRIEGSPSYTITVAADQAEGIYALAGGANGFGETVTICVEGGGSGSITVGKTVTLGNRNYALDLDSSLLMLTVSGGTPVGGIEGDLNGDGRADIVMTIDQSTHPADGATGAWLIQEDQLPVWGDLSQRNAGWEIFGMGKTAAGKSTNDVYIKNEANIVGAWTTDDAGLVTGWETISNELPGDAQVLGLGDFNGNGQSDLLLRAANGAVGCFFTNGQGWNYFQSLGDEWKLVAIGDLNDDGRDDVVLKHDAGFAGSWLIQEDGTPMWADLDTLPDGFEIVGAGDFNGDGTDDVLLKSGGYYGAWLVQNGNAVGWMGLGDFGDAAVEQIADFNGDGTDDLRIRTTAGDLGAQLVMGADTLDWKYYGSVGEEWSTGLAALS